MHNKVPVVHQDGTPLMPCSPVKARKLLQKGGAVKKWTEAGIFYIQLTTSTSKHTQPLVLGYDPGAKYDGFCIASKKQMQTSGMIIVENRIKKKLEQRRNMRRARRFRKTRRRPARFNNRKNRENWLPPSIKAKVEMRIAFLKQLLAIYPISQVVVEDVKIDGNKLKGQKGRQYWTWTMVGKTKLYRWLEARTELSLCEPEDTARVRKEYGLTKIGEKKAHVFESQAVDGFALCIATLGTQDKSVTSFSVWRRPENPRRQLHRLEPKKGGIRPPYGGSVTLGFKKNTVVEYKGKLYRTGGTTKGRLSLHSFDYDNRRITQNTKPEECRKVFVQSWFHKKVV
ncbi:RRXRR domain-containing protein [Desulfitobacterium chlororespirans]|uniref:RRXRR protein n=1 Tax=Desulfitobacterium chlororespirans DSM 11544 TaxID=1121395 RepID=A0A1M7UUC1_9FIRM|nr:RRXRR domain-containing protein [Desulfitobacterium chlororespirans]SHN86559.1 RRXRR protein [Desulfitobacterium chlororespirans DSM 11544]